MNQQYTILCVDDEPINLALLKAVLEPKGYQTVLVHDGEAALAKLHSEQIDLVLLDVMMPGMDGFEVCRRIKADEVLRNIPVVMITGYAAREQRIRGIEAGAEDFLAKPFDSTEVLARITMLLKVKSLNDQLATSYQHINSLICHGQQLTASFDPLHYDVMAGITSVIKLLLSAAPQPANNPQAVLLRLQGQDQIWLFSCREKTDCTLVWRPIPDYIYLALKTLIGDLQITWLNQTDLDTGNGALLVAAMAELGVVPLNLVCHQSEAITLCAMNYGRETSHYDAEILNSVATQSIFLTSQASLVRETEDAFAYTVYALARAAEFNDEDTGDHILRVGEYCALLAQRIGMSEQFVSLIRLQGIMHDVGKIHIPSDLLRKPGRLEPEEFRLMQQHTVAGLEIIGDHVRLTMARNIAHCHHERFDGTGYPRGLRGDQIPFEARILNLADQYDALRNKRCYKPAFDHDTTCRIILEGDGRTLPQHFDQRVLGAFKEIHGMFAEIFEKSVKDAI
ncbi:MAG: response regulator [Proteobacteria bacterium]|nr:response regulator [Pseudomonadota bacterium]MBU1648714.1 response regulator [Pseudomonadota bacterium]